MFTVKGLEAAQPPAIRISAVRAIYGFCEHLKTSGSPQIIVPYLPEIMEGLIQLATQFTNDVLSLVLECVCVVLTVRAMKRSRIFKIALQRCAQKEDTVGKTVLTRMF